jgi:hypothetical protein
MAVSFPRVSRARTGREPRTHRPRGPARRPPRRCRLPGAPPVRPAQAGERRGVSAFLPTAPTTCAHRPRHQHPGISGTGRRAGPSFPSDGIGDSPSGVAGLRRAAGADPARGRRRLRARGRREGSPDPRPPPRAGRRRPRAPPAADGARVGPRSGAVDGRRSARGRRAAAGPRDPAARRAALAVADVQVGTAPGRPRSGQSRRMRDSNWGTAFRSARAAGKTCASVARRVPVVVQGHDGGLRGKDWAPAPATQAARADR